MANALLTATAVTRESLRVLHQKLGFVGNVNRQYDSSFAKSGAKIGDSLKIRLPNQYSVRNGATLSAQDTTESSMTLQVATQKGVDLNFTSADLTLSLDDFSSRILEPAMSVLAAAIESDALSMRKDVYQQVNNTGAVVTFGKVLEGRKKLVDSLAPAGVWNALLNTTDGVNLVDALKGLFQDSKEVATQYREGKMGRGAGFDFMESTHLSTQLRGSGNGAYLVNDIVASGDTTVTVDTGTGTIKKGEIVTFAGVNSVHPETKADSGVLQQFVVTADYAGGAGDLSVSPAFISTGPTQNVSALPADNAAISIAGTASTNYGQSLLFHPDAFGFATADLVMPSGVDFARREVLDGVSMRVVRQYDINTDRFPTRIDVLYGFKTLRPQLACRLANLAG
ncbi:MAG TPA: P22 phage major capsid protein family protein [Allosphingosinicella sp.]